MVFFINYHISADRNNIKKNQFLPKSVVFLKSENDF